MSAWRGLANPERHAPTSVTDMAWCNVCDGPCYSPEACCCCLAAEVKRLTAERDALAAQVHQIRDVLRLYVETPRSHMSQTDALGGVEAALRGESDG